MIGRFFDEGFGSARGWPLSAMVVLAFAVGLVSVACGSSDHTHSGEDIDSGTVSEARIDDSIARAREINAGKATYTVMGPWVSSDQASMPVEVEFIETVLRNERGTEGQAVVGLTPSSLPSSLYGKSMLLTGVELCYGAVPWEKVEVQYVNLMTRSSSNNSFTSEKRVVHDDSPPALDRNVCHMFSGTPQLMGTNSYAHVRMSVVLGAGSALGIGRATFYLEPSDTSAAPL